MYIGGIAGVDRCTYVTIRGQYRSWFSPTVWVPAVNLRLSAWLQVVLSAESSHWLCLQSWAFSVATSGVVRRSMKMVTQALCCPQSCVVVHLPPPPTPVPGKPAPLLACHSTPPDCHTSHSFSVPPLPSLSPVIAVCVKEEHQDMPSPDRSPSPQLPLPIESIKQERDN